MPSDVALPPIDGSITVLPGFLDFHAEHNPDRPCFVFPDDTPPVSFKEFSDATHRLAHWVRPARAGPDAAVVAIIIHTDSLLYLPLLVAVMRAGLVPFPMSPRNSPAAVVKLVQQTACHALITHAPFAPLAEAVAAALPAHPLTISTLPELTFAFPRFASPPAAPPVAPYPGPAQKPAPKDVVVYLHSSGSTGLPKAIPQTQISILHWTHTPTLLETRVRGLSWGSPILPGFHVLGIYMQILAPLTSAAPVCLFAPTGHRGLPPPVPTADNIIDVVRRTGMRIIGGVPSLLEEWSQNPETVKFLASLDAVCWGGAPLSQHNGDRLIAAGVKLYPCYGTTETGPTTRILDAGADARTDEERAVGKTYADWAWMAFPSMCKLRWVPQGNGTYELIYLSCETHQPSVENLTNGEKGYATSDLWEPHPTKPGLWRVTGRTDDLIVLSNSEKFIPVGQENQIAAHAKLMGAVIFGYGRAQPGVLVEPRPDHAIAPGDEAALVQLRNEIWPQVEKANAAAPAFGRIFKEMIIVTDAARPFPRAGKGSVMRKAALALYEAEIDQLYKTVEESSGLAGVAPPARWSLDAVLPWLQEQASQLLGGKPIEPAADLFLHGLDSLNATFLRNRIIGALRGSGDGAAQAASQHVQPDFVFQNPTLAGLAKAVIALVDPTTQDGTSASPVDTVNALIAKYTEAIPARTAADAPRHAGVVVLVTGTTGSLGAHVLASLVADPRTRRVVAVNRGAAVLERHKATFEAAGLPLDSLSDAKVQYMQGDIVAENLRLAADVLEEIRSSVTDVVHCAWRVDFNLSVASFEPYIAATVQLLRLVPQARFFYTSSISVAQGGAVPEAPLHDPARALSSGYSSSKFVAEEVLANARGKGWATTVLRIGQVSGSSKSGAWNTAEWVPSLVKSSVALGALPLLPGTVAWVPMDAVASSVVDVVGSKESPQLINIVHPKPVEAAPLLTAIQEELGGDIPIVPLSEWVRKLEAAAGNTSQQNLQAIPAAKLLPFFQALEVASRTVAQGVHEDAFGSFATAEAQRVSPTLAALAPLDPAQARAWVKYWKKSQFI